MKNIFKNEIFKLFLSLFLIAATISLLLAGVNLVTKDRIAQLAAQKEIDVVRSFYTYGTTFEKKVSEPVGTMGSFEYFEATGAEGGNVGYAVTVSENGYGGEIKMMVCFDALGQVNGMGIIDWSETNGVGTRITGEGFFQQFVGKVGPFKSVKGSAAQKNEIVALSGATITSKAATAAVNKAYTMLADKFIEE